MHSNLKRSLAWILSSEGGFAVRKEEPGGSVNKGISMLVFQEYRAKHRLPKPTVDDLRRLTEEKAYAIYEEKFAKPIHFDDLPAGLDFALLDTAVMEGVRGSVLLLQEALNINVTGVMDVTTHDEARRQNVFATIATLTVLHMNKKMHAASIGKFARGWGNRLVRRYNKAREMMT